jgi:hypothetical protein
MVKRVFTGDRRIGLESRRRASHLLKPVKPVTMRVLLIKIPVFEKKNRMSFTRIALETHITHMSTGVKFYWLASKILHAC